MRIEVNAESMELTVANAPPCWVLIGSTCVRPSAVSAMSPSQGRVCVTLPLDDASGQVVAVLARWWHRVCPSRTRCAGRPLDTTHFLVEVLFAVDFW